MRLALSAKRNDLQLMGGSVEIISEGSSKLMASYEVGIAIVLIHAPPEEQHEYPIRFRRRNAARTTVDGRAVGVFAWIVVDEKRGRIYFPTNKINLSPFFPRPRK